MSINNVNDNSQLTPSLKSKQTNAIYDSAESKKEQNHAIVRAQMDVSLKMGNEPLALLYKTALSAINDILDPTQETKPIQSSYENQIDVSPEATAKRIVSLATGFYPAFQEQNPDMDPNASLDKFISIISGGIDQGFKDARDILEGLSVLEGQVATDIDSTYVLVQEGLKLFTDNFFAPKEENITEN